MDDKRSRTPAFPSDISPSDSSMLLALLGGTLAAAIGVTLWTAVTAATGWRAGWMVVGMGACVGLAVRYFGRGSSPAFGMMGALLALLGSMSGYFFSLLSKTAASEGIGIVQAFFVIDYQIPLADFPQSFRGLNPVFLAIALWMGFRFSLLPRGVQLPWGKMRFAAVVIGYGFFVAAYLAASGEAGSRMELHFESGDLRAEGYLKHGSRHGKWVSYYQSGRRQLEQHYRVGVLHGPSRQYYESGEVMSEGLHADGMRQGVWTFHHQDGTLQAKGSFDKDRQEGQWQFRFPDGGLSMEVSYVQDHFDGLYRSWHADGKPGSEGRYAVGKKVGPWKHWDSSGTLRLEMRYRNDTGLVWNAWSATGKQQVTEGEGFQVNRYPDEVPQDSGRIEAGLRVGQWHAWYSDGKLESISEWNSGREFLLRRWSPDSSLQIQAGSGRLVKVYDNGMTRIEGNVEQGLREGEWRTYHPGGSLMEKMFYQKGNLKGPVQRFYPDGKPQSEGEMLAGEPHGQWIWYHSNGQEASRGRFEKGLKVGEQIFFDTEGRKTKVERYRQGELLETVAGR